MTIAVNSNQIKNLDLEPEHVMKMELVNLKMDLPLMFLP